MRPVYHRATENMGDDASDLAEGFHELPGAAVAGLATLPARYVAPGEVGLFDAIRTFCVGVEGPSRGHQSMPETLLLAEPVRGLLAEGQVQVTCIPRASPPLRVHPAAFRDDAIWMAVLSDQDQLPVMPELGLMPGFLVVKRSAFAEAVEGLTNVESGEGRALSQFSDAPQDRLTAAYRLGREIQQRFELHFDYHFNRKVARGLVRELLVSEGRADQFSKELTDLLVTLIANPKWDGVPPPPDEDGRRPQHPGLPFNGVEYPRAREG